VSARALQPTGSGRRVCPKSGRPGGPRCGRTITYAITAAQQAYAQTGLMPELLCVYHLLGDPAMKIQ
jgi:hypothetical protein